MTKRQAFREFALRRKGLANEKRIHERKAREHTATALAYGEDIKALDLDAKSIARWGVPIDLPLWLLTAGKYTRGSGKAAESV